jgi:hypothetical protein
MIVANGKAGSVEELLKPAVEAGLIVSFCYGPCGSRGVMWSVDVLNTPDGSTFDKPFGANSLEHACQIVLIESRKRGWVQ